MVPQVLVTIASAQSAPWMQRLRAFVDDRQRLWLMGGALACTLTVVAATVLNLSTPIVPGSLTVLLQAGSLGSNAKPI